LSRGSSWIRDLHRKYGSITQIQTHRGGRKTICFVRGDEGRHLDFKTPKNIQMRIPCKPAVLSGDGLKGDGRYGKNVWSLGDPERVREKEGKFTHPKQQPECG